MVTQPVEVTWLDARETVSMTELSRVCGLTEAELRAASLRRDFELDLFVMALLLEYLDRIEALERQVKSLEAHLPAHANKHQREGPQPWHEPHGSSEP